MSYEKLKFAILNKKQVTAVYDGYYREMCPHTLGTKNGRQSCLFYQFNGETSKGRVSSQSAANWKAMFVNRLTEVTIQDGEWHTHERHSRSQTCVDYIDVEVEHN